LQLYTLISSTGSCFEETGGKDSVYVHYDNPDEMAVAISNILENDILKRTCSLMDFYTQKSLKTKLL
jgi:hypothetical protein